MGRFFKKISSRQFFNLFFIYFLIGASFIVILAATQAPFLAKAYLCMDCNVGYSDYPAEKYESEWEEPESVDVSWEGEDFAQTGVIQNNAPNNGIQSVSNNFGTNTQNFNNTYNPPSVYTPPATPTYNYNSYTYAQPPAPVYTNPVVYQPPAPQPPPYIPPPVYQQPSVYHQPPLYQQPVYQPPAYQQPPVYQQPVYQPPIYQQPPQYQTPPVYIPPQQPPVIYPPAPIQTPYPIPTPQIIYVPQPIVQPPAPVIQPVINPPAPTTQNVTTTVTVNVPNTINLTQSVTYPANANTVVPPPPTSASGSTIVTIPAAGNSVAQPVNPPAPQVATNNPTCPAGMQASYQGNTLICTSAPTQPQVIYATAPQPSPVVIYQGATNPPPAQVIAANPPPAQQVIYQQAPATTQPATTVVTQAQTNPVATTTPTVTYAANPVATNPVILASGVKELPSTGIPAIAWVVFGSVPLGYVLRRFGSRRFENKAKFHFIWEERKFKTS
jgi:hypothetical protein